MAGNSTENQDAKKDNKLDETQPVSYTSTIENESSSGVWAIYVQIASFAFKLQHKGPLNFQKLLLLIHHDEFFNKLDAPQPVLTDQKELMTAQLLSKRLTYNDSKESKLYPLDSAEAFHSAATSAACKANTELIPVECDQLLVPTGKEVELQIQCSISMTPTMLPQESSEPMAFASLHQPASGLASIDLRAFRQLSPGYLSALPTNPVLPTLDGTAPPKNVIFTWGAKGERYAPADKAVCYDGSFHKDNHFARIHGRAMSEGSVASRSTSEKAYVETSLKTTSMAPVENTCHKVQDAKQENGAFIGSTSDQFSKRLQEVHNMYSSGNIEAKKYHEMLSDIILELHNTYYDASTPVVPIYQAPSLIQAEGEGVSSPLGQAVSTTPVPFTTSTHSSISPMLHPPVEATVITTTSTASNDLCCASISSSTTGGVLTLTEVIAGLKLLEIVSIKEVEFHLPAVLVSLLPDAYVSFCEQLKSAEKYLRLANSSKQEDKECIPISKFYRILQHSRIATLLVQYLATYAHIIFKTLKANHIKSLKNKQNRLRLIATEAATRKWKGSEVLHFIADFLKALHLQVEWQHRVLIIQALVSKLISHANKSDSHGLRELYSALDFIFPGCDATSKAKVSSLTKAKQLVTQDELRFRDTLCHGCHRDFCMYRFRCIDCAETTTRKVLNEDSAVQPNTSSEFLLCSSCFLRRGNDNEKKDMGQLHHSQLAMLNHRFVCELPLHVLLGFGCSKKNPLVARSFTVGLNYKDSARSLQIKPSLKKHNGDGMEKNKQYSALEDNTMNRLQKKINGKDVLEPLLKNSQSQESYTICEAHTTNVQDAEMQENVCTSPSLLDASFLKNVNENILKKQTLKTESENTLPPMEGPGL